MADRYRFLPHRTVSLGWPIDWSADPLRDHNWRFQLHALTWLEPLLARWQRTGDAAARDRAVAVARSWSVSNPRRDPASVYAWEAHATALRASVFACMAGIAPPPPWLVHSLRRHGRLLADPATQVPAGNHALNQAIALLDVGCRLDHDGWMDLAGRRLRRLLPQSVDRTGVADEQSIGYQRYVLERWRLALDRLAACGLPPLPGAARLDRMPRLLAFATQPDGRYLRIGDTTDEAAQPIPGTIAEFAATGGSSGPMPSRRVAVFPAGYLLARTGWGETRAFADEVLLGLRFGPGRFLHGHDDGGAVTLYGYGVPLLLDPGFKDYDGEPWRGWFRSRAAHDTVVVDGRTSDAAQATRLLRSGRAGDGYEAQVRIAAIEGVTHDRRVVMSLESGIVVVEDVLRSRGPVTTRQLWHLPADGAPRRAGGTVWTRRERGNVTVTTTHRPRPGAHRGRASRAPPGLALRALGPRPCGPRRRGGRIRPPCPLPHPAGAVRHDASARVRA